MKSVTVAAQSGQYEFLIGKGFLDGIGEKISEITNIGTVVLVCDDIVDKYYSSKVVNSLQKEGFKTLKYVFKNGEKSKNINVYRRILEFLAEHHVSKSDLIIALGGGVTGDLSGFAASTYMRGIPFIQIPTTLLAAVDASVGGKNGINVGVGKNLAGTIWQPAGVYFDLDVISTLPDKSIWDGMSEIIKYGMIYDEEMFESLSKETFIDNLETLVCKSVEIKSEIINKDEYDQGQRQILNFGHTLGHAIEILSSFFITHGHAVAIGMALIAIACEKNNIIENCSRKLIDKLREFNLPYKSPFDPMEIHDVILSDKKRRGNYINLAIPKKVGECDIYKLPVSDLYDFIVKAF